MLRNETPKKIENEGRARQKTHSSWSIFRAKMGMGLGAKIWRFSETILESTKVDLDSIFGFKMGSQDRSPKRVFQGSNFETRLLKKMHPSQAKTMFLHVDEVWKWVDLGFQNRSKIVTFFTSILEAIFVDFFDTKMKVLGVQDRGQISAKIDLKTIRLKCWKMCRSSCLVKVSAPRSGGLARGLGGLLSTTY